jgi:hypothetical protein
VTEGHLKCLSPCLLINNHRSEAYIQKLLRNNLVPESIIYADMKMPGAARTQATHTANESIEEIITRAHRERKHFGEAGRPNWFAPKRPAPEKYRTFDPEETVVETLERAGLSHERVAPTSINDPVLVDAVARCPSYYVLFSGGGILRKDMLSLHKKFLHIHPGIVDTGRFCWQGVAARRLFSWLTDSMRAT